MGPCAVNAMDCGPCATPRVAAGLAVRSKRSALLKSCVKVMLRPWSFWDGGVDFGFGNFSRLDGKSTVDGLFRVVVYFYSLASRKVVCSLMFASATNPKVCAPYLPNQWLTAVCLRFGTEVYPSGS